MNHYQRKLLENWTVVAVFFVVLGFFQDDVVISRGIFVPVAIYLVLNASALKRFKRIGPSPKQVIETNPKIRLWCAAAVGLQIVVAFSILFSGRDLGDYLPGFASICAAVVFPLVPPIIVSQVELYRRLAEPA